MEKNRSVKVTLHRNPRPPPDTCTALTQQGASLPTPSWGIPSWQSLTRACTSCCCRAGTEECLTVTSAELRKVAGIPSNRSKSG